MFSSFIRNFPSRLFCLSSTLFWLIMNTLAADNAYRIAIEYGRNPVWHEVWLRYIPWWGNWIILTPIVIALIKTISLEPKQRSKFIGVNLTLMILVMCFYWFITALEVALIQGDVTLQAIGNVIQEVLRSPMHLDVLMYLAVACIGFSGMYYNRSQKEALVNVKLTNQLLEVELQSLKSQLSPHFLFNTLNTISGLIRLEQKSEAVIALNELSKMFRTVLENQKNQLITLREEMAFIHSYLAIQKIRFEDKIEIDTRIDKTVMEEEVPFMLLHTLVENAVQHGSQLESNRNLLRLTIKKSTRQLEIVLTNQACKKKGHAGFGIGLEVSKKRLHHLYGREDLLTSHTSADGVYTTRLTIPIRGNDV